MKKTIFIIDDEEDIAELVSHHLEKSGFNTKKFFNGKSFFKSINSQLPDLVILDLMLPDIDGIEICKRMRQEEKFKFIPIIMLTAKTDETDKILGLEFGADDYVTKPFSPKEIVARVKAVLRRYERKQPDTKKIEHEGLIIDLEKYEVFIEGKKVELTTTEFRILQILATKKGWAFTRDQLLDLLWGREKAVLDRTIDVHIKNLREKLGHNGKIIKNIRGVGYKLEL